MSWWSDTFGGGSAVEDLGPAPKLDRYPTPDDAKGIEGLGYGTGIEGYADGTAKSLDGTGYSGDPRQIASWIAGSNPVAPPASATDVYRQALLAVPHSAIAALGFDPHRIGLDMSGDKTSLAGFYVPASDLAWANTRYPSAVVHESFHRGLQQLRDSGMLTDKEDQWLKDRMLSGAGREELAVRRLMQTDMGNPEATESSGKVGNAQQAQAREHFEGSKESQDMLRRLEAKAATLIAQRRPGGPR